MSMSIELLAEPIYFPLEKGVYEVAPGLRPLGANLGCGEFDKKVFQISAAFAKFRENKIRSYAENITKYRPGILPENNFKEFLVQFLIQRLQQEYPLLVSETTKGIEFLHTGDRLDKTGKWFINSSKNLPIDAMDVLDFLSLQFPEDWALTSLSDGNDELSYLNVCSPSHWSPEEKYKKSFLNVHHIIPGSDKMLAASKALVEAMINKGPYVRFVWSFVTDKNLNHHPIPAPGFDAAEWKGRSWDPSQNPPFHLRVERQVTFGFPQFNQALFTIRVSHIDGLDIVNSAERRQKLRSTLESMSPASRIYKGVESSFEALLKFLE